LKVERHDNVDVIGRHGCDYIENTSTYNIAYRPILFCCKSCWRKAAEQSLLRS